MPYGLESEQHTKTHSNTMQHAVTRCNAYLARECAALEERCYSAHSIHSTHLKTLQRTATHCNALQRTTARSSTLQHATTHYRTLQLIPGEGVRSSRRVLSLRVLCKFNSSEHAVTHCDTPQYSTLQYTTARCNMLQHTTTHCVPSNSAAIPHATAPYDFKNWRFRS